MTASSGAAPPAAMPRQPAAPRPADEASQGLPEGRARPHCSSRPRLVHQEHADQAARIFCCRSRTPHPPRPCPWFANSRPAPPNFGREAAKKANPPPASCTPRPSKLKRTLPADMSAARSAVAVVEIVHPKSNPRGAPPLARSSTLLPCCGFDMNYTEPDQASEPTNKFTRVDGTEDPAQTLHLSLVRAANSGRAGTKHCQSYSGPGLKQKSDARRLDFILLHITRGLTSRQRPLSGLVIVQTQYNDKSLHLPPSGTTLLHSELVTRRCRFTLSLTQWL